MPTLPDRQNNRRMKYVKASVFLLEQMLLQFSSELKNFVEIQKYNFQLLQLSLISHVSLVTVFHWKSHIFVSRHFLKLQFFSSPVFDALFIPFLFPTQKLSTVDQHWRQKGSRKKDIPACFSFKFFLQNWFWFEKMKGNWRKEERKGREISIWLKKRVASYRRLRAGLNFPKVKKRWKRRRWKNDYVFWGVRPLIWMFFAPPPSHSPTSKIP